GLEDIYVRFELDDPIDAGTKHSPGLAADLRLRRAPARQYRRVHQRAPHSLRIGQNIHAMRVASGLVAHGAIVPSNLLQGVAVRRRMAAMAMGSSETSTMRIVTTPKFCLITGMLPNRYPPHRNRVTHASPPRTLNAWKRP